MQECLRNVLGQHLWDFYINNVIPSHCRSYKQLTTSTLTDNITLPKTLRVDDEVGMPQRMSRKAASSGQHLE